jgi:hypothetical protein
MVLAEVLIAIETAVLHEIVEEDEASGMVHLFPNAAVLKRLLN